MEHSEYRPGDYVVGSYTDSGLPLEEGEVQGSSREIQKLQQSIVDHAMKTGGVLLNDAKPQKKTKKAAKPIIAEVVPVVAKTQYIEAPVIKELPPKAKKIYLYNAMGRIKLQVEDVLENEMAFCVIFSCEDDMIFIPKPGETLTMVSPDGNEHAVYFADTIFPWTDNVKQLMILFKATGDE
jgi:hypothetical protein